MKPGKVIVLVLGCLLLVPGVAMLVGGGTLSLAYATQRDDDGFFDVTIDRLESESVALTAEDLTFSADPGSPDWILDALDADVRLRVTSADSTRDIFVGIARERDLDAYLAGVGHDEVIELDGRIPVYRTRTGGDTVATPTDQTFWTTTAWGPGTQTVTWEAAAGRWAVAVMHADGSPGVAADVNAGVRAGFLLPLGLTLLGVGLAVIAAAVALILTGAKRSIGDEREIDATTGPAEPSPLTPPVPGPVVLEAELDDELPDNHAEARR